MEKFTVPQHYCPFNTWMNPYVEMLKSELRHWLTKHRLIEREEAWKRYEESRFSELTALAYPMASCERLIAGGKLLCWMFFWDDQFDEGVLGEHPEEVRHSIQTLLQVLEPESPTQSVQSPLATSLRELWEEYTRLSSLEWQTRFREHTRLFFETYYDDARDRRLGNRLSWNEYVARRHHGGGAILALDLIELLNNIQVPDALYYGQAFQTLLSCTANSVCWFNDIISLPKEMARGELANIVLIIQHERGCSLQEAVDLANEYTNDQVRLFITTAQQIPAYPSTVQEHLDQYVNGMKTWMRANHDWSHMSYRYTYVEWDVPRGQQSYFEPLLPSEMRSKI